MRQPTLLLLTANPPSSKRRCLLEKWNPGCARVRCKLRVGTNLACEDSGVIMRQVIFDYVSEDVSNASVDYWYIDEGEPVEEGDDLAELRTDDGGLVTIAAPTGGILRERYFESGDIIEVGDVIATIDEGLEDIAGEDASEMNKTADHGIERIGNDDGL